MTYNVLDYGAVGDGSSMDTKAVQAAIDECSGNGGGVVLLPGGHVYRTGAIVLKSNVEFHLETGAVIKASDNMEDHNLFDAPVSFNEKLAVPTYENCEYNGKPVLYFIYAKDCENVSITGMGSIDGNEQIYYGEKSNDHIDGKFYPRMPLLFIENVRHLSIINVTLTNSAFWTTHLVGCCDVLIEGIRILNNLTMANCDGIDPDHCKDVRISDCHIESADDCIVFKNTGSAKEYGPCENICVTNCTLVSSSAAIKFGTESEEMFRNITISNCDIHGSNRGISLQLRDDGCIENVLFSNLNIETKMFAKEWWGCAEPICITAVRRKEDTNVGYIRNVTFRDINCDSENGIMIYGDPHSDEPNIQDIIFDNVQLNISKKTDYPKNIHDLRPTFENQMFEGALAAVYARYAKDIRFNCSAYSLDEEICGDVDQAFDIEECDNFVI